MEELLFIHLNEEDFRLAIFEQLNGPIRYDPDRLTSLRFNPLLSETYKKSSLSSHHDPDANFFTESRINQPPLSRHNWRIVRNYVFKNVFSIDHTSDKNNF